VQVKAFPWPSQHLNIGGSVAGSLLIFLLVFAFLQPCQKMVASVVQEKELRLREYMRVLGLLDAAYWGSWFASHMTILMVSGALCALIGKCGPASSCRPCSGEPQACWQHAHAYSRLLLVPAASELPIVCFAVHLVRLLRRAWNSAALAAGCRLPAHPPGSCWPFTGPCLQHWSPSRMLLPRSSLLHVWRPCSAPSSTSWQWFQRSSPSSGRCASLHCPTCCAPWQGSLLPEPLQCTRAGALQVSCSARAPRKGPLLHHAQRSARIAGGAATLEGVLQSAGGYGWYLACLLPPSAMTMFSMSLVAWELNGAGITHATVHQSLAPASHFSVQTILVMLALDAVLYWAIMLLLDSSSSPDGAPAVLRAAALWLSPRDASRPARAPSARLHACAAACAHAGAAPA
jgi:hypothetical protein